MNKETQIGTQHTHFLTSKPGSYCSLQKFQLPLRVGVQPPDLTSGEPIIRVTPKEIQSLIILSGGWPIPEVHGLQPIFSIQQRGRPTTEKLPLFAIKQEREVYGREILGPVKVEGRVNI